MVKAKGQISLLVLVIAAISLTFGLSFSKRTVNETQIDTNTEESKQAFNIAESALNKYYGNRQQGSDNNLSGGTAAVVESKIGGSNSTQLDFPQFVANNDMAFFWLMGHNSDGSLDYNTYFNGNSLGVCVNQNYNGAVAIDTYYRDNSPTPQFMVKRGGFNVVNPIISQVGVTGFLNSTSNSSCGNNMIYVADVGGSSVAFNTTPTSTFRPVFLVIRPMSSTASVSGTKVRITSSAYFPSQGSQILSTGTYGQTQRTIRVNNLYSLALPYNFVLNAITAGGSIKSN